MSKEMHPAPLQIDIPLPVEESQALLTAWNWVSGTAGLYLSRAEADGNSHASEWIDKKITHTADTVMAMADIFPPDGVNGLSRTEALLAAVVHDVGRFPELLLKGDFCDAEFDHGTKSAQMLLNESPIPHATRTRIGRIAWAIHAHNKLETREAGSDPLVLYLRDADKLAILRRMDVFIEEIFGKESCTDEIHVKDDKDRLISPKIQDCFINELPISYSAAKSAIDRLVIKLAWIFDLGIDRTRRVFIEEQIPQKLLRLIEKVNAGLQPEIIGLMNEKIGRWTASCSTTHSY